MDVRRLVLSILVLAGCHGASAESGRSAAPPPAPPPVPEARRPTPEPGADFIGDAKLLYRIAACGGDEAVAPELDKIVARHCKLIDEHLDKFRALYFDKGRTWFDTVVPKDAPKTVSG